MPFDKFYPYILTQVTDDTNTVRSNLAGSTPFPLLLNNVSISRAMTNETQSFELTYYNEIASGTYPSGRLEPFFAGSLGNLVNVFIGAGSPGTNIITGVVERWQKTFKNKINTITFYGKDFAREMLHTYISNVRTVTSGTLYSTAVRDLINDIDAGVTWNATTIPATTQGLPVARTFYRQPLFEAIKTLAEEIQYDFWVDANRRLNFRARGANITSIRIDSSTNVLGATTIKDIEKTKNQIWIYGGRLQAGGGSVINEGHTYSTSSDTYFLRHMYINDAVVISGTVTGLNFVFQNPRDFVLRSNFVIAWTSNGSRPDNNTVFSGTYTYNIPGRAIFATVTDPAVREEGKQKRVQWIKRPDIAANIPPTGTVEQQYRAGSTEAVRIARQTLQNFKNPKEVISVELGEYVDVDLNDKITIHIPEHSINNQKYKVQGIDIDYSVDKPVQQRLTLEKLVGTEV